MYRYEYLSVLFLHILVIASIGLGLLLALVIFAFTRRFDRPYYQANKTNEGDTKKENIPITPTKSNDEEKSSLTISDWITFLTSEKWGVVSSQLNLGAALFAFTGILFGIGTSSWWIRLAIEFIVIAVAWFANVRIFGPLRKRGILAKKILNRVISGELINVENICKEWVDGIKLINRANEF